MRLKLIGRRLSCSLLITAVAKQVNENEVADDDEEGQEALDGLC